MMIDKLGQYQTASKCFAEVAKFRNGKAIGWVEDGLVSHATIWRISNGLVYTGRVDDDLVGPLLDQAPAQEDFRITAPGHYRTRGSHRVEVVAVRPNARGTVYAVGYGPDCGLTWLGNGQHWNWASGTEGSSRALDIVAPWLLPHETPPESPGLPITAPGLYRDELGRKVEVVAIRDKLAIGLWPEVIPPAGGSWYAETGLDQDNPSRHSNLVGPWREPAAKSTKLLLCRTITGDHYVAFESPGIRHREIVARKVVTITEGEGM